MELTEVQKRAAELAGRNVVVSAGAGTGKTAVLVERFVSLVQHRRASVNEILTMTFTEKAADEMKRRIAHSFHRLGMRKERTAVETAYVSTIHSFCSRVIKEHPFAAGIDPQFDVLDDIDRQLLISEVFEGLFSEGDDDFLELTERYGEPSVRKAILSYVDLCRSLGREQQHVRELLDDPAMLGHKARAFADERAKMAMREIEGILDRLPYAQASGRCEEIRQQVLSFQGAFSDVTSFRPAAEAMNSVLAGLRGTRKKKDDTPACLQVREELSRVGNVLQSESAAIFFDCETEESLLPSKIALLKGAALFWQKYETRKREQGVLDYEDLQLIARGLLRDNPATQSEYRGRFRFVLVDEFQDINWLQKELIDLLASGDNLFVVGDACQSIYGFRNADVEIFVSLMHQDPSSPRPQECLFLSESFRSRRNLIGFFNFLFSRLLGKGGPEFHPLETTRSDTEDSHTPSVEILLFQHRQNEGGRLEIAETVRRREAAAVAARIAGAVRNGEILVQDAASGDRRPVSFGDVAVLCRTRASYAAYSEALEQFRVPFCAVGGQSFYEKQEVADLMSLLSVMDNPLQDIPMVAVLRSPFVAVTDETLLALRSVASASLSGRRAGERQLNSGVSHDVPAPRKRPVHVLDAVREVDSIAGISDSEKKRLLRFREVLEDLRSRKDGTPAHILLKQALDSTPFWTRMLASPSGRQKAANISKFLDLVREYEAAHGGGIGGFLRFYQVMRYYGPREEEAVLEPFSGDVVKLMTIHAAKGLEFPVVVVADMLRRFNFDTDRFLPSADMEIVCSPWQESSPDSSGRRLVYEERKRKQLGEEKRLLYVAATRARDHLILASGYRQDKEYDMDGASCPVEWLIALVGEESLPQSGSSCDIRLEEADVRVFVDAPDQAPEEQKRDVSLLERYRDRIAEGSDIPVTQDQVDTYGPQVKSVLERVLRRDRSFPDMLMAEVSASQLIEFEICPYRFFLREILKFPERDVMASLGHRRMGRSRSEEVPAGASKATQLDVARRRFGELVHLCMEHVDFQAGEHQDIPTITTRFFTSANDARAAEQLIQQFLGSEQGQRLRHARQVYREFPVKALLGDTIIIGVIDVLYQNLDGDWTILDFKTGSEGAADPRVLGYEFQMLLYAFLVKEATSTPPRKAIIHFLRTGASHTVAVTVPEIERTTARAAEILTAISRQQFSKASGETCRQCQYAIACAPGDTIPLAAEDECAGGPELTETLGD